MIAPLDTACLILPSTRTSVIMSALDCGWVCLQYRKANGQVVQRLGTRNPTLVLAYGSDRDVSTIRSADEISYGIVYWDFAAGGIRSCSRTNLLAAGIPESTPEINH